MGLVKVWNDNKYPFKQEYRGEMVEINPGEFIEMERDDAIIFKGMFYPPLVDGDGRQDPRSFKMIRVEGPRDFNENLNCVICGHECDGQDELNEHLKAQHSDRKPTKDESAERAAREAKNVQKGRPGNQPRL